MNASNAIKMNKMTGAVSEFTSQGLLPKIIIGLVVIAIISGIGYLIYKYVLEPRLIERPTTANMKEILKTQKNALNKLYEAQDRRKPLPALAENQNFLVNYHLLAQQDAGYLGPFKNGVYSENDSIPLSVSCGANMYILNIYDNDGIPILKSYDSNGIKVSLNDGSPAAAINAIKANAFTDTIEGRANIMKDNPCIIYLKFDKMPSKKCAEAMANALYSIKSSVLTTNEKGDFTHRRGDNMLFLLKPADVAKKIIIITNIDTEGFSKKTADTMRPDLDYYINGRVWKYNELNSDPKIRSIYEISYSYLNTLNDDGIKALQRDSRVKYFIVSGEPTADGIKKAKEYGVQCIGGFIFESSILQTEFTKGAFAKDEPLRYVVQPPIKIEKAPKEMNSNGGIISVPKI
jgi:hypothetical protein